jgi:hypothetical protein
VGVVNSVARTGHLLKNFQAEAEGLADVWRSAEVKNNGYQLFFRYD